MEIVVGLKSSDTEAYMGLWRLDKVCVILCGVSDPRGQVARVPLHLL